MFDKIHIQSHDADIRLTVQDSQTNMLAVRLNLELEG
jgi:hypothetical protein